MHTSSLPRAYRFAAAKGLESHLPHPGSTKSVVAGRRGAQTDRGTTTLVHRKVELHQFLSPNLNLSSLNNQPTSSQSVSQSSTSVTSSSLPTSPSIPRTKQSVPISNPSISPAIQPINHLTYIYITTPQPQPPHLPQAPLPQIVPLLSHALRCPGKAVMSTVNILAPRQKDELFVASPSLAAVSVSSSQSSSYFSSSAFFCWFPLADRGHTLGAGTNPSLRIFRPLAYLNHVRLCGTSSEWGMSFWTPTR